MDIDFNLGTIITSAITAIIFTGGTNYFLQKTNRKGNEVVAKGNILIEEIHSVNQKRIKTMVYIVAFYNIPETELYELKDDYQKEILAFELKVKQYSILFNKKTNKSLQEFIMYLKEVDDALLKYINNKPLTINVNNEEINRLYENIIKRIQKQI
ncbi:MULTISPECIES: hypothetical protein [Bacillus]|uniref:Uncharacterized protein n=1 Tax=Bacillus pseudomycoides TaxID=64104 RepID=A0A2B6REY0_9BACI|nr:MULTISPECIES: hypothetical protein [Bacillus]PEA80777.1 hypothetical protein CON99_26295 [Bacillus pseudomycoides]PED70441.1 hypothetical protein CON97_19495 [Bacillus pseudomycoides]PEI33546.1 hypothetical protein CN620_27370 [Bacillus pseudomycoides]PEJ71200.1 hypothetical protein CN680_22900 [Bacillus pseudomycoides]PEM15848.1 hypothetical protein CN628_15450 [Bacillus pseudomycoides]